MMKRIFILLLLIINTISCSDKGGDTKDKIQCQENMESQEASGSSTCNLTSINPGTVGGGGGGGGEQLDIDNPEVTNPDILPSLASTFETNIIFINTTDTQQEKFDKAIEIIKKVIATKEFRDRVINHTYNGVMTYVDNGGYTNSQIYEIILEGAETLNKIKNNKMDMQVELYYAATNTVGYTYSNTPRVWVNTKYFNTNPVTGVASNLMHEWLHKLGFKHATVYSPSRDFSVPYAIGRIVGSVGRQFID